MGKNLTIKSYKEEFIKNFNEIDHPEQNLKQVITPFKTGDEQFIEFFYCLLDDGRIEINDNWFIYELLDKKGLIRKPKDNFNNKIGKLKIKYGVEFSDSFLHIKVLEEKDFIQSINKFIQFITTVSELIDAESLELTYEYSPVKPVEKYKKIMKSYFEKKKWNISIIKPYQYRQGLDKPINFPIPLYLPKEEKVLLNVVLNHKKDTDSLYHACDLLYHSILVNNWGNHFMGFSLYDSEYNEFLPKTEAIVKTFSQKVINLNDDNQVNELYSFLDEYEATPYS